MSTDHIRNFAIIAHIDHGKSTLADRLLELTHTVEMRDMQAQILDSNPIERERGITIKLAPVRMRYQSKVKSQFPIHNTQQGKNLKDNSALGIGNCGLDIVDSTYTLNLIDTPGHVDFTYEVSRSLAACEGAVLVVDATQGVQAQTLANLHLAQNNKLTIIPVVNKIDMPNARVEETIEELVGLGFSREMILPISAKTGQNVDTLLEKIIEYIPPPVAAQDKPARALVFSSQYDTHKGVVVFVRVVDGEISKMKDQRSNIQIKNQRYVNAMHQNSAWPVVRFLASGADVTPIEVGYFTPSMMPSDGLLTGEVGYIATGLKDVRMAKVGDTITVNSQSPNPNNQQRKNLKDNSMLDIGNCGLEISKDIVPLPGYREPKPMVFLGLFPLSADEIVDAREAMEKLRLSDSAFSFRPISSLALGNGFHCGFLGLLHAEVVQERLQREFNLSMIATAPSVEYQLKLTSHKSSVISRQPSEDSKLKAEGYISIQSASEFPDPTVIEEVKEPIMMVSIFSPKSYVGAIMSLAQEKRGEYMDLVYQAEQAKFTYLIPLSEMIIDFFDRLKSVTEGYASLDYEFFEHQTVDVVRVDILVNHEQVDALSFLAVRDQAHARGGQIADRLSSVIPRQQFEVPIQAAIGGKVVARADVKAFRKDVIAKLYGGDRTRKDKLLKKQAKGKARMKRIGTVEIPQDAFFQVLKRE
ncbi:elongation factor 4 [Candidatus Gottesmanbacteria bacterium]|nr:elongation factor 4 [Candidatus Gottesmanbacteria bacterium]